jgi:hypothetical protein
MLWTTLRWNVVNGMAVAALCLAPFMTQAGPMAKRHIDRATVAALEDRDAALAVSAATATADTPPSAGPVND